jgi:5-methylcytosine-specific restriction endonuclease McrA
MAIDYSDLPQPKPTPRVVDRIATKRALAQQERECRRHVKKREDTRCRACGRHGDHLHHIIRRSRGGRWLVANVVLLCLVCHQFAHAALLQIRGNPEPGHLLTIESRGAARAHLMSGPAWR